jgi:predicted phage terminase large subunit-like protein
VIAEEETTYRLARLKGNVEHARHVGDLLDPVREPLAALNQLTAEMGAAKFNAQYMQRPEYEGDCYVDWSWLSTYTTVPDFDFMFLSVDPAIATNSTSDWSACSVIGVLGERSYIVHIERRRCGFEELAKRLDYLASDCKADAIFIERASIGISLIDHLEKQKGHTILHAPPVGSKKARMIEVLPQIERGRVVVPIEAKWIPVFRSELQAFPNGAHDDQVDALSQFLRWRQVLIERALRRRVHRPHLPLQHDYYRR